MGPGKEDVSAQELVSSAGSLALAEKFVELDHEQHNY